VNGIIALVTGQFQRTHWTKPALTGIGYLIVFGSWIGYTAYIYLLEHVPTPKVATYAYVNPIVAVFLGWIILHEQVDAYMLLGTAIIIASVWLVNTSRLKGPTEPSPIEEVPSCPKTVNAAGD
jgi:drug/metabolite transporter (DMT)-like permease